MRSIRSCNLARTSNQRGFALLWAIGLAVLFFMLIELMLIDSARELKEAQRFRSRMVAMVLAENGAELAALRIADANRQFYDPDPATDWQGTIDGRMDKNEQAGTFVIIGSGVTAGTERTKAEVRVEGYVEGTAPAANIVISFTRHAP